MVSTIWARKFTRDIILQSDLAGEFPLYVYHRNDQILYSKSISELLNHPEIKGKISINPDGISFLLQAGVIPPPMSIFENIFIIAMGQKCSVSLIHGELKLNFEYVYPFTNEKRISLKDYKINENELLELIAEATVSKIDNNKETFMFHSAGKDSNTIATALASVGYQDKVTLITHKSKGEADESEISESIAKKLGFKHIILKERICADGIIKDIDDYFENVTLPVVDSVTLAYPLYSNTLPQLKESNIIDGGGNDAYMQTPLSPLDKKFYYISHLLSPLRVFAEKFFGSESKMLPLTKTHLDWWCGFGGLSFKETQKIFPLAVNTKKYFKLESVRRYSPDKVQLKTDFLTSIMASEQHIRKFRTAADSWSSNPILPFANENIANYISSMPIELMYDKNTGRNKIILVELLKNKIDLDSDKLGKKGYVFDFWYVLNQMQLKVKDEIINCSLWDHGEILNMVERLFETANSGSSNASRAQSWIHRLYLISGWFNKNKYLNVN